MLYVWQGSKYATMPPSFISMLFSTWKQLLQNTRSTGVKSNVDIVENINFYVFSALSSNINEVIKTVLNSLFFFYEKISHTLKALKAQKVL